VPEQPSTDLCDFCEHECIRHHFVPTERSQPVGLSAEAVYDVLKVVNGLLLGGIVGEFDEGEAALTAGLTVEGKAALTDLPVLAEEIEKVLAFGLEREVADVDGHSMKKLERIPPVSGIPGDAGGMELRTFPGEGPVLVGLSRRCVPKGARAAWNSTKPTTVARAPMEKFEADAKENKNF